MCDIGPVWSGSLQRLLAQTETEIFPRDREPPRGNRTRLMLPLVSLPRHAMLSFSGGQFLRANLNAVR
jgi:hypothetical protein